MSINIPTAFWDKYNEACDFFIDYDHIGRECTIVYPPKRTACTNCMLPVGMQTNNTYRDGGPMPFNFGECPLCGGKGYTEEETTGTVRLRIYWGRADWIRLAGSVVAEGADVMIIGYMKDANKVRQASSILLADSDDTLEYRATVVSKITPWGFGKNRYFFAFLKGA